MSRVHHFCASKSSNVAKELKDVFLTTSANNNMDSASSWVHLGDRSLEILNDNLGALEGGNTGAIAIKPEVLI